MVDQDVNRLDRVSWFNPFSDLSDFYPCFLNSVYAQVSTGALLVSPVTTEEGEHIPLHPVPVNFGISGDRSEVPFLWPVTLLHHISEDSPFWKVTTDQDANLLSIILQWDAEQWSSSDWELLLWITGTSSSGAVSSRSSYKSASSNLRMVLHLCNRAGEVDWGNEFSTTSADVTVEKVINLGLSCNQIYVVVSTNLCICATIRTT